MGAVHLESLPVVAVISAMKAVFAVVVFVKLIFHAVKGKGGVGNAVGFSPPQHQDTDCRFNTNRRQGSPSPRILPDKQGIKFPSRRGFNRRYPAPKVKNFTSRNSLCKNYCLMAQTLKIIIFPFSSAFRRHYGFPTVQRQRDKKQLLV